MNHTIQNHRKLYALLNQANKMSHRHDLVYSYSHGRTTNSAELSDLEIAELIRKLENEQQDKPTHSTATRNGDRMRKRILSMCYTIGWTIYDDYNKKVVVDMERLNNWMRKYSYKHKPLNEYRYNELRDLVSQFEKLQKTEL